MKGIRFIPTDTRIGFIRFRMISFVVSGLLMLASVALFFTIGLNYGIDFKGGTLIEVRNKSGPVDLSDMRVRLSNIGVGEVRSSISTAASRFRGSSRGTATSWASATRRCSSI